MPPAANRLQRLDAGRRLDALGWQNQKGTQFVLTSAKSVKPPPSVEPLEALWFFRASSWKEANRAWYARNGWTRAG